MISQNRYIDIVSGTGANQGIAERKLGMRVMTTNPVLPPGIVAEFSTLDAVQAYFGSSSEEARRAAPYIAFINKNVQKTSAISFARWANEDLPPMIVGDSLPKTLSQFAGVSTGTLTINVGNNSHQLTALNFTTATSLTQVAGILQTAIQEVGGEPQLTNATVSYNTNTNQFTLTGSTPGSGVISVTPTELATDVSELLGWGTDGSVLVEGQSADEPVDAVSKATGISNNFGSIIFATGSQPLTQDQIEAVAAWVHAQNNQYMYSIAMTLAELGTFADKAQGYSGLALNVLSNTARNDFVEQSPCEIMASINYNLPGAGQNFMFYQFANRNVTVSSDSIADIADGYNANYIGVTQINGQSLAFYQRGILCGGSNDATDMGVYANEIWLKSAISAAGMRLFLAVGAVPPNDEGAARLLGVIQPVLNLAGNNGTFVPGKELDATQQAYISSVSGDSNAWRKVQTLGYWFNLGFSSYLNPKTNRTEWKATYQLIYSKGDSIRFIEGQDIMI